MFVRAKPRGEKVFYYLVRSERREGQVRQKTAAYPGESPTLAKAITELRASIAHAESRAAEWREKAEAARAKITPAAYSSAVALARAPVVDGVPTFIRRGSRFNEDHAKQYHSHLKKARSFERLARRLRVQLENLQRFDRGV